MDTNGGMDSSFPISYLLHISTLIHTLSPHIPYVYSLTHSTSPISYPLSFYAGASICEIETDKASVSLDAQDEGFIAKILVGEGETIQVLTTIASIG